MRSLYIRHDRNGIGSIMLYQYQLQNEIRFQSGPERANIKQWDSE